MRPTKLSIPGSPGILLGPKVNAGRHLLQVATWPPAPLTEPSQGPVLHHRLHLAPYLVLASALGVSHCSPHVSGEETEV